MVNIRIVYYTPLSVCHKKINNFFFYLIAEATAVVIIKNIKVISKDDANNTDIEKNEKEIEIIIKPEEGENIRYRA